MTEPCWLGVTEIAAAYAARQLSPVELLQSLLDRIEALDPKLHAFIRLDADIAMHAAQLAEREIASGRWRGPLHGVPVGIKDIIDVAGVTNYLQLKASAQPHRDTGRARGRQVARGRCNHSGEARHP